MTGGATGPVTLMPASVALADWRAIYEGAGVRLDPACAAAIDASARVVEAIVAKGEPVYGINTGFGKLASARITPADLAQLQRNIVLSHAAGVGEPAPEPIVRLMLALKLASLAQGASGVRRDTVAMLEAMLARDLIPVVPCQGSVGASGDLAPLAHMAAAMIGVGEMLAPGGGRVPAGEALRRHGLQPLVLGPQGGPRAAQRHAVLDRLCAGRAVRGRQSVPRGARHRRAVDRSRQGLGRAIRRARARAAAAPRAARVRGGAAAR